MEAFDPFQLNYNIRLFAYQLRTVVWLYDSYIALRTWENPLASGFAFLFLLNVAYRDYISYLPAMLLFINMILLLVFLVNPHCFENTIHHEADTEEHSDHEQDEKEQHHHHPSFAQEMTSKATKAPNIVRKIKGKFQRIRTVYKGVIDSLAVKQHQLALLTQFAMRFEGLYKWRTPSLTVQFFVRTLIAFVVMCIVPFRYVFPIVVVDQVLFMMVHNIKMCSFYSLAY